MRNLLHCSMLATIVLTTLSASGALAQTPTNLINQTKSESGCLSEYPDGTYGGDRPLTRNEFAVGMNACLDGADRLIQINRAGLATRVDFEALIQQQQQLNEALRELGDRVSGQESPVKR